MVDATILLVPGTAHRTCRRRHLLRFGHVLPLWLAVVAWSPEGLLASPGTAAEPSAAEAEYFEKEVRPLLVERCWQCHGDSRNKGGLKLTSRAQVLKGGDSGPAAVAGKPDESLLLRVVRYQDMPRMPPKGKLNQRQIDVLARWVKEGLPWPGTHTIAGPTEGCLTISDKQRHFWAFQPVRDPVISPVRDIMWSRSAMDRFILAALETKGLSPARPADKRTLLRRVTFDLIGLPPTPAEMDAFLADDSPQAYARVVERLLASPQYGQRWGRHWLDVVRYADARDLIQLPPPSDFREIWRYRDWVVEAFNRDLPYTDFVRYQVAGDLLSPPHRGGIDKDGLVATGLLALADFVPGDVDKEQMIADYVNDEVDVVGRAFLGLTLACARCHDHKFDPIGTEDYYALAGIFFSTRLIPGPVAGNTPLVRVPLLAPNELAKAQAQAAADERRRVELEGQLPDAVDREYISYLKTTLSKQVASYVMAACQYRQRDPGTKKALLPELAKRLQLHEGFLAGWVDYLGRVEHLPATARPPILADVAAGKLAEDALARSAGELQQAVSAFAARKNAVTAGVPDQPDLKHTLLLHFRADDPQIHTDAGGRVSLWPNRANLAAGAKQESGANGPSQTSASINGHAKTVLRFDGSSIMSAPRRVPPIGSLVAIFRIAADASPGQRLLGWEDSDVGSHGLGLMTYPDGRLHAILRKNGAAADLADGRPTTGFEIVSVTWGPSGTTLHRDGKSAGAGKGIDAVSSDPAISALHLGGPGSGGSPRFRGDIAEIRVYNRPLEEGERRAVEAQLRATWFAPADPKRPSRDRLAELCEDILSPRGPFGVPAAEQLKLLPGEAGTRLAALNRELEALKKKPAFVIPQAVSVQDGGPPGTRHEGFKDAAIFVRGNHKKLGKIVPRGFPRILTGDRPERITRGSGRLQLAHWLIRPEHPLTARVLVNRLWQHHFGEGLVRTPNDFGERGDRPSHPELLDFLAARFIKSGWSVKAMHRLILLSATYQQTSRADAATLAQDPDNRLFGRMNRRRLDAEAIRDSLLAVAGRLDPTVGGPAFADLPVPRRTLYLLSARTGANTSDFGRLFDRADPGSIVAQRGQGTVSPQALFFLNDPFVGDLARALADRVLREVPANFEARIRRLYLLTLGRPPTEQEIEMGMELLNSVAAGDPWERLCHLILCTNEFVYLD
jgi:hypothetical protein